MSVHDVIVDTWDDDIVIDQLAQMKTGRLVMNPDRPDEPFEDDDGYLTVRLKDAEAPERVARELQRRVLGLRVVEIVDRTAPTPDVAEAPGSYGAQRRQNLLGNTYLEVD